MPTDVIDDTTIEFSGVAAIFQLDFTGLVVQSHPESGGDGATGSGDRRTLRGFDVVLGSGTRIAQQVTISGGDAAITYPTIPLYTNVRSVTVRTGASINALEVSYMTYAERIAIEPDVSIKTKVVLQTLLNLTTFLYADQTVPLDTIQILSMSLTSGARLANLTVRHVEFMGCAFFSASSLLIERLSMTLDSTYVTTALHVHRIAFSDVRFHGGNMVMIRNNNISRPWTLRRQNIDCKVQDTLALDAVNFLRTVVGQRSTLIFRNNTVFFPAPLTTFGTSCEYVIDTGPQGAALRFDEEANVMQGVLFVFERNLVVAPAYVSSSSWAIDLSMQDARVIDSFIDISRNTFTGGMLLRVGFRNRALLLPSRLASSCIAWGLALTAPIELVLLFDPFIEGSNAAMTNDSSSSSVPIPSDFNSSLFAIADVAAVIHEWYLVAPNGMAAASPSTFRAPLCARFDRSRCSPGAGQRRFLWAPFRRLKD